MADKMISILPTAEMDAFKRELMALFAKYCGESPAEALLAIASYTVGQIVAMQDQRQMTPDKAMAIVSMNIQTGNNDCVLAVAAAAAEGWVQ
jgi:phosphoribosylanthranilate isomerase